MLEQKEFDLLYDLIKSSKRYTQREIAAMLGISLGKTNQLIRELSDKELIIVSANNEYQLTQRGKEALKPYKVRNAIIMAAGMSSRFAPLSYEKPKGLLKVKGDILIEREIQQLHEAGIEDITIVVGYMKEKFFYLEDKFGVKIVVNEDYYRYNNSSTLIRVVDELSNTYICSSDNYFVDNVFEPYVYHSFYSAVYAAGETDEYCLDTDKKGKITKVSIGGFDSWYMLGHVYFDKSFSASFKDILEREYKNNETKEHLWENLYIKYIKELPLYIKKYAADKVLEFDSLEELREFDKEYVNNANSKILDNICNVLECNICDIVDIKAIKAGFTNTSFQFRIGDQRYVYRHPGRGTEKYINRKSESISMVVASELELDHTFIYMDKEEGWKISRFISGVRELNYDNETEVTKALVMIRKLHDANVKSEYNFNIWSKTKELIERLEDTGKLEFEGYEELMQSMQLLHKHVTNDSYTTECLCHNDCCSPNFLLDEEDHMFLVDWEYSGNNDPASDLGTFVCCSDYTYEKSLHIVKEYLGRMPEGIELGHYLGYVAITSYYWYVWALYQETRGNSVGDWLHKWYKNSKMYVQRALELYK